MRKLMTVLVLFGATAGCGGGQYRYVKVLEPIPGGKTDGLSEDEQQVERDLLEVAKMPIAAQYLGRMFKSVVVVLQDFDNLTFTAKLGSGGWTVSRGSEPSFQPDYVVPFTRQNLTNLKAILADGNVDDGEAYRIHYVTFVPALRSFMRNDALYNEYVAKRMALPALIHMTLKNPNGYVYNGTTREISATAANVNGQWLVFQGKLGNPDIAIEVTHTKAAEFSGLLFNARPEDMQSKEKVDAYIDRVKVFIDSVVVYRKPHA
jgi:hypothetical protein